MITERRNPKSVDIDLFPTERILRIINAEDALVAPVVGNAIPEITKAVDFTVSAIQAGGHLIYAGAGTSGRIAMLDAAECPATFSTPPEMLQAVMAGGSRAFAQPMEGAEDDRARAETDLRARKLSAQDILIGIAASGDTPYTMAAIEYARSKGAKTIAVVSTPDSSMCKAADLVICVPVGPEVITGSTRMKAGTAQKLVLNMISTATMIRLGMTYSNWMVNVSMSNTKLRERGVQILQEILGVHASEARRLAEESGGKLKTAVVMGTLQCSRKEAEHMLENKGGNLRKIIGHLGNGRE